MRTIDGTTSGSLRRTGDGSSTMKSGSILTADATEDRRRRLISTSNRVAIDTMNTPAAAVIGAIVRHGAAIGMSTQTKIVVDHVVGTRLRWAEVLRRRRRSTISSSMITEGAIPVDIAIGTMKGHHRPGWTAVEEGVGSTGAAVARSGEDAAEWTGVVEVVVIMMAVTTAKWTITESHSKAGKAREDRGEAHGDLLRDPGPANGTEAIGDGVDALVRRHR